MSRGGGGTGENPGLAEAPIQGEMSNGMPTPSPEPVDLVPTFHGADGRSESTRHASGRSTWRPTLGDWQCRPVGRRLMRAWRVLAAPRQFRLRRRAARTALNLWRGGLRLDCERGFVRFGREDMPGIERLIGDCRDVLDRARPQLSDLRTSRSGQRRLAIELFSDDRLGHEPAFLDFALQEDVLLPVVEYLNTVPYLARVALAVSVHLPELQSPTYFQRFHLDNDDARLVKLFINIVDVGQAHGPFCFLPAEITARVLQCLRRERRRGEQYWTFSDEEVYRHCDRSDLVELTGPAGSGAFLDSSRCLHFGSRVGAGRERPIFALTFLRYHRLHENASNHLVSGTDRDPLRRLVLRPPVPHPPGYFYPGPSEA